MKKIFIITIFITINVFGSINHKYVPIYNTIYITPNDYIGNSTTQITYTCEPNQWDESLYFEKNCDNNMTYTLGSRNDSWQDINVFAGGSTAEYFGGQTSITKKLTITNTYNAHKKCIYLDNSLQYVEEKCEQNGTLTKEYNVTFFKFGFKNTSADICKYKTYNLKELLYYPEATGYVFTDLSDNIISHIIEPYKYNSSIGIKVKYSFTNAANVTINLEEQITLNFTSENFDYFTSGQDDYLCKNINNTSLYKTNTTELGIKATESNYFNNIIWNTKQDYDVIEMQSKDTIDASLGYADNSSNFIRFYNTAAGFPSDGSNSTYNSMTLKSAKIMLDINATVEVKLQKQVSADGYTENLGDLSFSAIFNVKANEPYTININKKIFGVGLSNDTYRLVVKSINGNYFNSSSTSQPNQPNGLYQNNISFGYNGNERIQIGNTSQKSAFFDVLFVFNKTAINNNIVLTGTNGNIDLTTLNNFNKEYPINLTYTAISNLTSCNYTDNKEIIFDNSFTGKHYLDFGKTKLCPEDTIILNDYMVNTLSESIINYTQTVNQNSTGTYDYLDNEKNHLVLKNKFTIPTNIYITTTTTMENNCIYEEIQTFQVYPTNSISIINTNNSEVGFNKSINLDYTSERTATNLVWKLSDGQYSYLDKPKFYLYDKGENVSVSLTVYDDNNCPIIEKLNDAFFVTSTKDINGKDINIYPIPFNNELSISGYDHNVSIVDVNGKEVLNGSKVLNTSSLPTGTYFLKIENQSLKIIK